MKYRIVRGRGPMPFIVESKSGWFSGWSSRSLVEETFDAAMATLERVKVEDTQKTKLPNVVYEDWHEPPNGVPPAPTSKRTA